MLILRGLTLGLLGLTFLVAVAAIPVLTGLQVKSANSTEEETEGASCWGCAPYERLLTLYELQQVSARPRVRQLERMLNARATAPSAREEARAALHDTNATILAAEAAAGVLRRSLLQCLQDDHCRRDPSEFQQGTCMGSWPGADDLERIAEISERVFNAGSQCHGFSCPVLDCGVRQRMETTIAEMIGALANLSNWEGRSVALDDDLTVGLANLRLILERLPLILSEPGDDAFPVWYATVRETPILALVDSPDAHLDGDVSWRLRLLNLQLSALYTFEATPPSAAADWEIIARHSGEALAQVNYLEWLLTSEERGGQCETLRPEDVDQMAMELRRASAALAVCGSRAGCGAGGSDAILAELAARLPDGLSSIEAYTGEGYRLLVQALDELDLRESESVALFTDLETYGIGEAIRVLIEPTSNVCLAEDGARIGLFAQDDAQLPIAEQSLQDDARENGTLYAAPDAPGAYHVRVFAPQGRGGAELAEHEILVEDENLTCTGFSGVWDTNFGELRLYVREGQARGTYRRAPGRPPGYLTGEVDGRVLYGSWESELGGGGARLVLSTNGEFFRGSWSHVPGRYSGTGSWTGECISGTNDDADSIEAHPQGPR